MVDSVSQIGKLVSRAGDRCIKGSVYKVALVARLVFRKDVTCALKLLSFSKRRAARDIYKVLYAAVSNAQNNHGFSDLSRLCVADIEVGKALTLKRFRARARGRGNRVTKHYSRVVVKLAEIV